MAIQTLSQKGVVVEASELVALKRKNVIRVLHVDDDPSIQEITKLMLLDLYSGFEIDWACCVDDAFKRLAAGCYDIVVSDYEMPQKNGLQFLKELRTQNEDIPFILFTGKGREEVAINALNSGADAYYNKQGTPETVYGELAHSIKQTVERKKAKALVLQNEIQLQHLLTINKMLDASDKELMDYALEAIAKVTLSQFSFIGLTNHDETEMTIHSWSKTVMKECKTISKPIYYPISKAGVWAEPIRQRKPILIDDYSASAQRKKGLPEGHVSIKGFLGVPIFEKERIVAVAAVANKRGLYEKIDVSHVTALVTDMWRLIQYKITAGNLRLSEERLKQAEKTSHISHWEWTVPTGALVWGDEHFRIFGLPPETAPSMDNFLSRIHPDDVAFVKQSIEDALKGEPYDIDFRIILPDSVERVLNDKGEVEYDLKGKPLRMSGTVHDITERTKTETALKTSEKRHRAISEVMADVVYSCVKPKGKNFTVDWMSGATEKIFGYSCEAIMKRGCWKHLVDPRDLPIFEEKIVGLNPGQKSTCELRIVCADGSTHWIKAFSHVSLDEKTPTKHQLFGACENITERKKAEESLSKSMAGEKFLADLVRNASIAVSVAYPDGRLGQCNLAFETLTGYNEMELRSINWDNTSLTPSEYLPLENAKLEELERTGKSVTYEKECIRKDGSRVPVEMTVHPFFDPTGKISHYFAFINDITKRKQAEAERTSIFRLLESASQGIDAGLAVIGKNYQVIWANKRLMNLGVAPDKKCYEVFNNLGMICPNCGVEKIFKQNASLDVHEYKIVTSKGETIWIELRVTPLKDEQGQVIAAVELAVPITQRKQTEEIIKKIKEQTELDKKRLESILEASPSAIVIIDAPSGKFSYVNKRAFQIYGFDTIGLSLDENMAKVKAKRIDGTEYPIEEMPVSRSLTLGEEVHNVEMIIERANGLVIPIMVNTAPLRDLQGNITAAIAIFEDITKQKQKEIELQNNEAKLRLILDATPFPVALVDAKDDKILYWSASALKLFGHIAPTAKQWYEIAYPDPAYRQEVINRWKPALKKAKQTRRWVNTGEYNVTCHDGSVRICELYATFLKDMIVVTFNDITEHKKAEEHRKILEKKVKDYAEHLKYLVDLRTAQLKDANKRLVKSERLAAIGELSAMIGHDLRNPLAGIKNATYYLKKKGHAISETQYREMLETIDKSISHSDKIINDLLEYSREIHLYYEETTLPSLVDAAIKMVNVPDRIHVLNHIKDDTTIRVDSDKIMRVFINLITNAIDAMPEKGTIEITNRKTKNHIEIAFTDTGTGLTEDTLEKLFTPLFTTKAQGMGFGLAICKRMIEAHEGTINVKTAVNQGTTFTITFPTKSVPVKELTLN